MEVQMSARINVRCDSRKCISVDLLKFEHLIEKTLSLRTHLGTTKKAVRRWGIELIVIVNSG